MEPPLPSVRHTSSTQTSRGGARRPNHAWKDRAPLPVSRANYHYDSATFTKDRRYIFHLMVRSLARLGDLTMGRKVQFYRFNIEDGKLTREHGPPSPGTPIPDSSAPLSYYTNADLDLLRKGAAFSQYMEELFPRSPITPPTLRQRLSAHLWDLRRSIANWIYPINDDEDY